MNDVALLQSLVSIPGPPGREELVADFIRAQAEARGVATTLDAKGNVVAPLGGDPKVVVTAHMDEIAMVVRRIEPDGRIRVGALGGLFPWKIGEGPVQILTGGDPVDGILSVGSIHTESKESAALAAKTNVLTWEMSTIFTGKSAEELAAHGVRPGRRVVVHPGRRTLTKIGDLVAGYFLDDRADLVSWLRALESLRDVPATLVATTSEEVGGEGALYFLEATRPECVIALELGPNVPDARVAIDERPTVWTTDGYANTRDADVDLVIEVARELGIGLQFQALSRGGSDASCAASHGLCARPFTLGLPMENSHGYEVIHPGAMENLAKLTVGLVRRLTAG